MSGTAIVIIGGGGNRSAMEENTYYSVQAGDAIENTGTGSVVVTFVQGSLVEPINMPAGDKHTFGQAGQIVIEV